MSENATREAFAPEAPIYIDFPGAVGTKEGVVISDEGGDMIEVRYPKKSAPGGETSKDVAARQVRAREVVAVEAPADGEVTDEPAEEPAEEAQATAKARKPRAKAEPKEQGPARPKASEILTFAQDLVVRYGPTQVLETSIVEVVGTDGIVVTTGDGEVTLTDDEKIDLERVAKYQAGRVLIFFKRDAPEGHEGRRY